MDAKPEMDNELEPKTMMATDDWQNRELVINITNTIDRLVSSVNQMGMWCSVYTDCTDDSSSGQVSPGRPDSR